MIRGISGSLLSQEALDGEVRRRLRAILDEGGSRHAHGRLRAWHLSVRAHLGPTASARTIFDRIASPLLTQMGYRVLPLNGAANILRGVLEVRGKPAAALLVTGWGNDADAAWRQAVRQGIGLEVRWCFCATGPVVRLVDSRRTYSRRFVEFALESCIDNPKAFEIFWGLLRADAMSPETGEAPALDTAVALSERHRANVRDSLQKGVQEALVQLDRAFAAALKRRRHANGHAFEEALTVIYRILFLLFAEARGLVPRWHPVFRDSYTIESLRQSVEERSSSPGLWESLQAMARIAHRGCTIGSLQVPPFNGRLFSPGHAPLSESLPLDEGKVRNAVLALTTRPVKAARVPVEYGDLGVEQLGGVYERLLDFKPHSSDVRKATGSFYTPRSLTEFLVRRTLAPLVRDATPDQILALRIVDPAMGSGAFLVAACRYLASAYETALVREEGLAASDIADAERIGFRRAVAQQCLFGVDLNPMAVQLGRLSLWLTTLAADRPLTFLDHRLRVGNSLVGARFEDMLRQPPSAGRSRRPGALTLFDDSELASVVRHAVDVRTAMAAQPDDTLEHVRGKEQAIADLALRREAVRWKSVADLWCAAWFRHTSGARQSGATFGALTDLLLERGEILPAHTTEPLLTEARSIAAELRFFHWTLEFPEIFFDAHGVPTAHAGFDAVIGNPPWEMLRGDRGSADGRRVAHDAAAKLTSFTRSSGIYKFQGTGHSNLYQLFLERALSLVRPAGRLGLILPSSFAIDHGSSGLRATLLDRTTVDGLVSIENRDGVFPIHRSLKFLLLTCTNAGRSSELPCRFGVRNPAVLDGFPDEGFDRSAVTLTRPLIERIGGSSMALPELRTHADAEIVSAIAFSAPALGDLDGWHARFGRELNATDNRHDFVRGSTPEGGLPVIEGKHLAPFRTNVGGAALRIPLPAASRLLPARTFERPRLAYRDVAGATNKLTLIAAMVPAGTVTTHTVFCLKTAMDQDVQHFLCGIFNSFVANYLIRVRVHTHVGASAIASLPVPKPARHSKAFRYIAELSASLSEHYTDTAAARLQAVVARLYGLTEDNFRHIVDTFPLIPREIRHAALTAFCDIVT